MNEEHIDVGKVITVHSVIPENHHGSYNVHTHGLEGFGHKEFQALTPGYCVRAVVNMLNEHADRVINHGEIYQGGDTGGDEATGIIYGYVEVPGDHPDDPTRLRIVDLPGGCECEMCRKAKPDG